jgi:hypothetical protein
MPVVKTTYATVGLTASRVNLTRAWIRTLASRGDIPGAIWIVGEKDGGVWGIPTTWKPPTLKRGNPNFVSKIKRR